ncbi:serine hydrolase domain-containing protein [uncultured Dokdonia sp.]|uniref:serine hydrolase domain-containing protein n=1 Tax=uncultured Dokdonia sp. TaxID=575653 RepID=UPI002629EEA2|nr:serine hydrolase domain-containing protein [uncultured Dokdonia sp.]
MKHILTILIFLLTTTLFAQQKETQQLETIDQFLTDEYPKNEPGAVVLISKGDDILFQKAYGLASLTPKRKLKTDMIFRIGSMTKQFTSAAVLQLVEQGKVSLSDTIQQYVPYYPVKEYPITIHHLLSQTSGVPDFFDVDEDEFHLLAKEYTPKDMIAYFKDERLLFEPGSKWAYSNSNYSLLNAVIEKASGMKKRTYMEQFIFNPLGMKSSAIGDPDQVKKKRLVTGHAEDVPGIFKEGPAMSNSVGGVRSTAYDLFLWHRALHDKTVLSEFVVSQLTTEKKIHSGEGTGYGYGFFLRELQGSPTIQHGGNLFGFTTNGLYLPDEDIFVCVLSNTKFDRTPDIADYIGSILIDKPIVIKKKSEIKRDVYKEYIGIYHLKEDVNKRFGIELFDTMLVMVPLDARENAGILRPISDDYFESKEAKATITFTRNDAQEVIGITVEQNGTYHFVRIE